MSAVLHLRCGHTLRRKDHRFVSDDGQTIGCTQRCLDVIEGRTPGNYRDEHDEGGGDPEQTY